ncbi:MAG TPA: hypothetical protein VH063_05555 [Gaiellaceae bacterium]|nr:hypothetical protein [Gaiellaceae bacterium]
MAIDRTEGAEAEAVRRELARERERLVDAVGELRRLADLNAVLRARLVLVVGGALVSGFVLGGGIGATARLLFRHGREGRTVARAGRFTLVRH